MFTLFNNFTKLKIEVNPFFLYGCLWKKLHIQITRSVAIIWHPVFQSWSNLLRKRQGEPRHDKTNKVTVRPAKTQISLGIRPVWSESSLCAQWAAKEPSFLHADSEDSDQTGQMPRLIWVFAGRTAQGNYPIEVVFSVYPFWNCPWNANLERFKSLVISPL